MKDVISRDLIFVHQNFNTQDEIFKFLKNTLIETKRGMDAGGIIKGFYEREKEFSTYIDKGIAIPHCRCDDIKDASVVMITNDKPVTWTQKEEQADIIISLMIPASNENQIHIKILAQVAQLMLDDSFVSLVRNAATSEEIFRAVEKLNCQY